MIIVKLMGGLGNQMFQYATGSALAKRLNTQLVLDITGYDNMHPDDTPRHYELDCFALNTELASEEALSRVRPAGEQAGLRDRLARQLSSKGPIFSYSEDPLQSPSQFKNLRNNTYLIGWWQDEAYFKSIRSQLAKEFKPLKRSAVCKKIEKEILATEESVSLHVRRGDYVSNKNANKHHGLAPLDYYKTSIQEFSQKMKNPVFYIFSDDIAWCKKNIKAKNIVFVENTAAGYEDMYLMSLCKHNIIANSSFSWWGAWLNTNEKKIVIAPKVWFQNTESNNATDIVPSEWKRL